MKSAAKPGNKFHRYRETKRTRGSKLLRIWVPDPYAPGFAEKVARQTAALDLAREREVLNWVEDIYEWPEDRDPA